MPFSLQYWHTHFAPRSLDISDKDHGFSGRWHRQYVSKPHTPRDSMNVALATRSWRQAHACLTGMCFLHLQKRSASLVRSSTDLMHIMNILQKPNKVAPQFTRKEVQQQ